MLTTVAYFFKSRVLRQFHRIYVLGKSNFIQYTFLFATLIFAVSACSIEYAPVPGKDDFFEISEDGCMGDCKNFTMRIHGDGAFTFQRLHFPDSTAVEGTLNSDEVAKLFKAIKTFGFEKYDESQFTCKVETTDRGTMRMHLSMHGKMHNIVHYLGCHGFKNEEELRKFEKEMYFSLSINNLISR